MKYQLLDYLFEALHLVVIGFNLCGWVYHKTRLLNLVTLSITFFSWIGLGYFFGFGYCFLTDWHWQVKHFLGESQLPNSYIKYLLDGLTGINFDVRTIDFGTFSLFAIAYIISIYLNFKSWKMSSTQ